MDKNLFNWRTGWWKKVIQNIKAESNLCDVLKEFEVDIYLSSKVKMEGGYYYTNEPSQSSNNVKKMKVFLKLIQIIFLNLVQLKFIPSMLTK